MLCDNSLCIYQDKDKCSLSEISIDSLGLCEDCIKIDIEPELLTELKAQTLSSVYKKEPY